MQSRIQQSNATSQAKGRQHVYLARGRAIVNRDARPAYPLVNFLGSFSQSYSDQVQLSPEAGALMADSGVMQKSPNNV